MKQTNTKQKQKCKATSRSESEVQKKLRIALVMLMSVLSISCSTSTTHTEIDYQAINCAGWERGSISREDKLTKETKIWILSHIMKYDRDCSLMIDDNIPLYDNMRSK